MSEAVEAILTLERLEKRYGRVRALDGVDLVVAPGAVGLLGQNGAGKTTLLKVLLGLLRPCAGRARIAGFDPRCRAGRLGVRRAVGYMPEGDCLLPGMTGVELVSSLGRITGLAREDAMTRAHEVLDYVELDEARYRSLEEYSTGMKQRLKLAQALVHDPPILLLDEPTNGLDPKGRRHMLELIHDLGHVQGKNIVLCSHLLRDVERTCERVVVLHQGRVARQGDIAEMTRGEGTRLRVELAGPEAAFLAELERAGLAHERSPGGPLHVLLPGEDADADALFAAAARAKVAVRALEPVRSSLEEVFLSALREQGAPARATLGAEGAGGAVGSGSAEAPAA